MARAEDMRAFAEHREDIEAMVREHAEMVTYHRELDALVDPVLPPSSIVHDEGPEPEEEETIAEYRMVRVGEVEHATHCGNGLCRHPSGTCYCSCSSCIKADDFHESLTAIAEDEVERARRLMTAKPKHEAHPHWYTPSNLRITIDTPGLGKRRDDDPAMRHFMLDPGPDVVIPPWCTCDNVAMPCPKGQGCRTPRPRVTDLELRATQTDATVKGAMIRVPDPHTSSAREILATPQHVIDRLARAGLLTKTPLIMGIDPGTRSGAAVVHVMPPKHCGSCDDFADTPEVAVCGCSCLTCRMCWPAVDPSDPLVIAAQQDYEQCIITAPMPVHEGPMTRAAVEDFEHSIADMAAAIDASVVKPSTALASTPRQWVVVSCGACAAVRQLSRMNLKPLSGAHNLAPHHRRIHDDERARFEQHVLR